MSAKSRKPSQPLPGSPSSRTTTSAAPGTKDERGKKPKKEKIKRVPYPGLKKDEEGKTTAKVTEVPSDFDPKVHQPLRQRDFEDESTYLDLRADEFEKKAVIFRRMAGDYRKLGSVHDRVKAKRLVAMQHRMAELKAQLEAQGIDVEALLAPDEETEAED